MSESPDVESFDIEAWAEGTTRVTRSVDVYGKPHLQGEIEALSARLAGVRVDGEAVDLSRQIEALRAEMEASKRTFKFRSLSPADIDKVKDAMEGREGDDADMEHGLRLIAAQCVEPKGVTWQVLERMQEGLGGYFGMTVVRTAALARDGVGVTVPFSPNASHILGTMG